MTFNLVSDIFHYNCKPPHLQRIVNCSLNVPQNLFWHKSMPLEIIKDAQIQPWRVSRNIYRKIFMDGGTVFFNTLKFLRNENEKRQNIYICDTRPQWVITMVMLPDKWVFNQRLKVKCQNRWRLCFQLTRASRHCMKIWRYHIYYCLICFACKYHKMLDSHPITPYPLVTSYECIHASQKYLRIFRNKFYKVRYDIPQVTSMITVII